MSFLFNHHQIKYPLLLSRLFEFPPINLGTFARTANHLSPKSQTISSHFINQFLSIEIYLISSNLPSLDPTDISHLIRLGLKNPSILQQIPLGRFGTTDEVADAALFLIKNPYANNCVLNLDGGLSAV